jgi:hypothetical protein
MNKISIMHNMKLQDIMVTGDTYDLLKSLGALARSDGKSKEAGWTEICNDMGYTEDRTPAREAFEDGFYGA